MNIQPFIFNWKGKHSNTCYIEEEISKNLVPVTVINSEEKYSNPNWVNLGDSAFFAKQFLTALDLFDGDIFFHIQGDASYSNWRQLIEDAQKYFTQLNYGIYAPNINHTWYDSNIADINLLPLEDKNLKMVSCTDCTVWFIHKDIIDLYKKSKIDFTKYKIGWGIDLVFCALSHLNHRKVIRDYSHEIKHPKGTGYDEGLAHSEMNHLKSVLPVEIKQMIEFIHFDKEKIANFYK